MKGKKKCRFDADPNKNPDVVDLTMFYLILDKPYWIKGDWWAMAEVRAPLSAFLVVSVNKCDCPGFASAPHCLRVTLHMAFAASSP